MFLSSSQTSVLSDGKTFLPFVNSVTIQRCPSLSSAVPPKNKKRKDARELTKKKKKKRQAQQPTDGEAKIHKWSKGKFPHKPYDVVVFDRMIYDKLSKEVLDHKLVVQAELWCPSD